MRIDRKSLVIAVLAVALVLLAASQLLEAHCAACTQRGMDGTLEGLVAEIKMRNTAVSINVGDDQLICSTRAIWDVNG